MATTAAPTAPSPPSSPPQPQVLLVGIGGPTCSGKTTLTKHLLNLVRTHAGPRTSTFIVHQDDFAPPESSLVWNDRVGSADWDDPATSVEWARLRDTLAHVKATGALPATHSSHDELNPLPDLPVSADVQARLDDEFRGMFGGDHDTPTHIVFLDGFLLYYDRVVRGQIDLPVFLRIGRGLLRERRDARGGYVTAEGDCWKVSAGERRRVSVCASALGGGETMMLFIQADRGIRPLTPLIPLIPLISPTIHLLPLIHPNTHHLP